MDKKLKSLFGKIGMEQTSDDFTYLIMNKIETGFVKISAKRSFWNNYRFLLGYVIAFILVVPLMVPAVKYLFGLKFQLIDFDFNVIYEWFDAVLNTIAFDSVWIIISLSFVFLVLIIFYTLEPLTQFRRKSFL